MYLRLLPEAGDRQPHLGGDAELDLLLTIELGDVRIGGCLGYSDHVMVEFRFQKDMRQRVKLESLLFGRPNSSFSGR